MMSILKFGGSSLMNARAFKKVGNIIINERKPVVVLSAVKGVTDLLENLINYPINDKIHANDNLNKRINNIYTLHNEIASELSLEESVKHKMNTILSNKLDPDNGLLNKVLKYPNKIETQYFKENILATGEQLSCIILNNYLSTQGYKCKIVEGNEIFICDSLIDCYPHDVSKVYTKNVISPILENNTVPIVTGFYGRDRHDNIVTFKRNGSDITATFIADALKINSVKIYKVEANKEATSWEKGYVGIVDSEGKTITNITFDEAMDIAQTNRNVLSYGMLRPLVNNKNIIIEIKNTLEPELEGTKIIRTKPPM